MITTLFLSVSIDGLIADKEGIPLFPDGAWEDWCSLVNDADNVIAGRSSYEQLKNDDMASVLHPTHKIVLSSRDIELNNSSWQHAKSPSEALEMLKNNGVDEAIVGLHYEGVDYVVADGALDLGVTSRWYIPSDTGTATLWVEGDPAPTATVTQIGAVQAISPSSSVALP